MLYRLTYTRHDDRDNQIEVTIEGPGHNRGKLQKRLVDEVLDLGIAHCGAKPFTVEIAQFWPLRLGYRAAGHNMGWAQTTPIDEYSWYPAAVQEVEA